MNQFVGFSSAKLGIKVDFTQGMLRQFRQTANNQVKFPVSCLTIDRSSGRLKVQADYLEDDGSRTIFETGQLLEVRELAKFHESAAADKDRPGEYFTRVSRFSGSHSKQL